MSKTTFPGPYINDTKMDTSVMVYVPMEKTDIGARSSGLPKDIKNSNSIEHVGAGTNGKGA